MKREVEVRRSRELAGRSPLPRGLAPERRAEFGTGLAESRDSSQRRPRRIGAGLNVQTARQEPEVRALRAGLRYRRGLEAHVDHGRELERALSLTEPAWHIRARRRPTWKCQGPPWLRPHVLSTVLSECALPEKVGPTMRTKPESSAQKEAAFERRPSSTKHDGARVRERRAGGRRRRDARDAAGSDRATASAPVAVAVCTTFTSSVRALSAAGTRPASARSGDSNRLTQYCEGAPAALAASDAGLTGPVAVGAASTVAGSSAGQARPPPAESQTANGTPASTASAPCERARPPPEPNAPAIRRRVSRSQRNAHLNPGGHRK